MPDLSIVSPELQAEMLAMGKRIAVLEDLLRRIDAVTLWEHHPQRWQLGSGIQEEIEAALGIGRTSEKR